MVYMRLVAYSHCDLNQSFHPCHAHYSFMHVAILKETPGLRGDSGEAMSEL